MCVFMHPAAVGRAALSWAAALAALTSTELAEVCLAYLPASLYICCLPRTPVLFSFCLLRHALSNLLRFISLQMGL